MGDKYSGRKKQTEAEKWESDQELGSENKREGKWSEMDEDQQMEGGEKERKLEKVQESRSEL